MKFLLMIALAIGDYSTEKNLYDSLRSRAEEVLIIQVEKQEVTALSAEWTQIVVQAKIFVVESSINRLGVCDTIAIKYYVPGKANVKPAKFLQMPVLKDGCIYPAFLNKDKETVLYRPAIFEKSFVLRP